MGSYSYKDLIVWQKSMALVKDIYQMTASFPSDEKFGLSSQIQRAAVAIPSNIAEGHLRKHPKEFIQFLNIALGSAGELETQLLICQSLEKIKYASVAKILTEVNEIKKMLYVLGKKLDQ